jgi:hypothetical protein
MSDEDLEVLVTLDDPWYGPDEDTFHHLQPDTDWPAYKQGGLRNEMLFAFI